MDKTALQKYYNDTRGSLLANIQALKSLLEQASALSDAVHKLQSLDNTQVPDEVIKPIDAALENLYDSIGEMTRKVEQLFEDYKKFSDELFRN